MVKKNSSPRSGNNDLTLIGDQIMQYLESIGGGGQRSRLASLWKDWEAVAPGIEVLEHKDGLLVIGAEDALEAQELSMQAQEIMDAANAYLGEIFFTHLRVQVKKSR